ncbi:MAG: glycosyltransferase family 2 protein [Opitutaceae bacterium]|nr:glycosyltransferase family 2 protein [Opitutaceae bacterium]MBP9913991.1 glycosyltransferase family 2 protein [Opitutaceae bacterium]
MNGTMLLSIIVPVYKEEKNVPEFLRRLQPILAPITADYEIIFSLDPSPDRTEDVILEHRAKDERLKLLKFSRRVGQPMATLAGLEYSRGDAVIVMDVDLQDPPELVSDMVAKWREGFDIVLPQRRQRTGEPWVKKVVSHVGYKVINKIADVTIPPNTGDFRLMSRRVVNEVVKLKESHGFLRGMVAVVGFRQILLPFDRPARHAGATNYNRFFGSLRIGFNGIFCFSTYALQLSTMLGFAIAGFSFLLMGIYLFYKFMGWTILWGNPTLVILISFLGGIQLISVGILGEYIGRIYEEVRGRPKFILERSAGFEPRA